MVWICIRQECEPFANACMYDPQIKFEMDMPDYKPPDLKKSGKNFMSRRMIKREKNDDDSCVPISDQENIQKVPSMSDLSEDNSLGKLIFDYFI